jgi:hypothetical protein
MTEQECENVFQQLLEILAQHQCSDLIERIKEDIAEGQTFDDDVQTFKELFKIQQPTLFSQDTFPSDLKPARKASFTVVFPYTAHERLNILLNMIEQVIITPIAIEAYLQHTFLEGNHFQKLILVSQDSKVKREVEVQNPQVKHRQDAAEYLRTIINSLRKAMQ